MTRALIGASRSSDRNQPLTDIASLTDGNAAIAAGRGHPADHLLRAKCRHWPKTALGKRDIFASIGDQYKNISSQVYADSPASNTFFQMAAQRLQGPAGGKDQHIPIDSSSQVVPELSKASEPNLFPG